MFLQFDSFYTLLLLAILKLQKFGKIALDFLEV